MNPPRDHLQPSQDTVATKADLRDLEVKIDKLELRLDARIETFARDLKIWFGSVMVVAVGVVLAAIRYLPAGHP